MYNCWYKVTGKSRGEEAIVEESYIKLSDQEVQALFMLEIQM